MRRVRLTAFGLVAASALLAGTALPEDAKGPVLINQYGVFTPDSDFGNHRDAIADARRQSRDARDEVRRAMAEAKIERVAAYREHREEIRHAMDEAREAQREAAREARDAQREAQEAEREAEQQAREDERQVRAEVQRAVAVARDTARESLSQARESLREAERALKEAEREIRDMGHRDGTRSITIERGGAVVPCSGDDETDCGSDFGLISVEILREVRDGLRVSQQRFVEAQRGLADAERAMSEEHNP